MLINVENFYIGENYIRLLDNGKIKLNNKERIKSNLYLVNEAVNDVANTVANYQDSSDR